MDAAKVPKLAASAWRRVLTVAFALLVLGVLAWAYVTGLQLAADRYHVMAFGLYGVLLAAHLVTQSAFACREHRRMRAGAGAVCSYTRTVALTISAYQEDPAYLRQCLESVRALHYPPDKLRIIMVIDGNSPDDRYMLDMFAEVFAGEDVGTYVWEGNYHHPAGTKMAEGGSLSAGETLSAYTTTAGGEGLNTMETKMAEGRGPVGMEAPLTYTSMVEGEGPVATETPRGYTKMVEGRDRITMETPFTYSSEVEDERPVTTEMATGSTKMMDGVGRIAMEMAYTETGPGTPSAYTKVEMRAGPVAMERPSACTKMAAGGGPVTVEMPSADAEELGGGPPAAYAEVEMEDPGRLVVEELVRTQRCVCIMQRWGGKREVMYTAFRALGDAVDYVQVGPTSALERPPFCLGICYPSLHPSNYLHIHPSFHPSTDLSLYPYTPQLSIHLSIPPGIQGKPPPSHIYISSSLPSLPPSSPIYLPPCKESPTIHPSLPPPMPTPFLSFSFHLSIPDTLHLHPSISMSIHHF